MEADKRYRYGRKLKKTICGGRDFIFDRWSEALEARAETRHAAAPSNAEGALDMDQPRPGES